MTNYEKIKENLTIKQAIELFQNNIKNCNYCPIIEFCDKHEEKKCNDVTALWLEQEVENDKL